MSVCGFGISNNGRHLKGRANTAYRAWSHMIHRVFGTGQKRSSYRTCIIDERFRNFQDFADWAENQIGFSDYPSFQLDKDILFEGNKTYGPDTCAFVPREINQFLQCNHAIRGQLPMGVVAKSNNRYWARISENDRSRSLGVFKAAEDAHSAYVAEKRLVAIRLADKWKLKIDPRVYAKLTTMDITKY